MTDRSAPTTIDEYIAVCSPQVQPILAKIRSLIRKIAPQARERISYRMPAFAQDGDLIYFAAFKKHIGIYPPVRGDDQLLEDLARYRGEKGNLKFPLDEPIPYGLLRRVVKRRLQEQLELRRAKGKGKQ
jgi:uncharacterized protein YdhG (YjbR/CyaY superfamily)